MRFVLPVAAALSVVCLAARSPSNSLATPLAQANQAPPQKLTVKPVRDGVTDKRSGVLAGTKGNGGDHRKAARTTTPRQDHRALVRRRQEERFCQLRRIHQRPRQTSASCSRASIGDQAYVGTDAVIKAQIAQVKADKKMSPRDKDGSTCRAQ